MLAGIEFKVFISIFFKGFECFVFVSGSKLMAPGSQLLSKPGNIVHQHYDGKESNCYKGNLGVGGD